MRTVLDTNVLVSALHFQSFPRLRADWESQRVLPLATDETIDELTRVLHYPKFDHFLSYEETNALLKEYIDACEFLQIPEPPPAIPHCRDPHDRIFLQLALFAEADALITGDAHLLALKSQFSIPIRTPNEYPFQESIATSSIRTRL